MDARCSSREYCDSRQEMGTLVPAGCRNAVSPDAVSDIRVPPTKAAIKQPKSMENKAMLACRPTESIYREPEQRSEMKASPISLVIKALFLTGLILQVMLWPSVVTISASCIYALSELHTIFILWNTGRLKDALMQPGPFIFKRTTNSTYSYVFMIIMGFYFLFYFGLFMSHELELQPAMTFWLPDFLKGNYSDGPTANPPLPLSVTSKESYDMRSRTFIWNKHFSTPAPVAVGTVGGIGASGGPLICDSTNSVFNCFVKILPSENAFVPLLDHLYDTEIMVVPPRGVPCQHLEVYRVVLDGDRNVAHGLDYASSVSAAEGRAPVTPPACGIFGNSNWCLQLAHTFSNSQYRQHLEASCDRNDGRLILHLPPRAQDIDYDSGRLSTDLLLVTAGAEVHLHAAWKAADDQTSSWFPAIWKQLIYGDSLQGWRESSSLGDVFVKFASSITPLLIVAYYLTTGFQEVVAGKDVPVEQRIKVGQVLLLCIFVLLPAILLYLSIGAWVPMAGCILCILAVNHDATGGMYHQVARPALIFIFAVTNSIQFGWLISLIANAGYSAFCYEVTLHQLYDLSSKVILSSNASPLWLGLMLPSVLLITGTCLLGAGVCVVLEIFAVPRPPSANTRV